MKRALAAAVVVLFAACAGPRRSNAPAPEVKDPNLILVVSEAVAAPDEDGVSLTKVFVDGKEAGETAVGPKSVERTLKLKLPVGNQPIRLEQWTLPDVGEWTRLDDSLQPRERFVRIEDGDAARLELRFAEGEASNALSLSRVPVSR